ncbi:MAG: calcium-binding protein [Cuspidothrix sp.]
MANLFGTNINDILNGTSNPDIIFAFDGNDAVNGGDSDDAIDGGNGNDTLNGGNGNDILIGANGNDLFRGSSGNDTVNGGQGIDTADYSQMNTSITLRPTGVLNKGVFGTDQLAGMETIIANSSFANNTIDASSAVGASITVNLQTQSLAVNGVPGVGPFTVVNFDDVRGTNLNDIIIGDAQNNILFGNNGNDLLYGGIGNDNLFGGAGADTFVFKSLLEGIDIIKDFNWLEGDRIEVSKLGFGIFSHNEFSYNNVTGALFFQSNQFAIIENKPQNFVTFLDIVLV